MREVDMAQWKRRERYEFFKGLSWPFWSVSFPVDVTGLHRWSHEKGLSFYYALVYLCTRALEEVEAFHYKDRGEGIVWHDRLVPSFTDLHPGQEDFHIVTLEAGEDLADFCRRARELSRAQRAFVDDGAWQDEMVYFTCLPWMPITALSNERELDPTDSIPRLSWGKYVTDANGRDSLNMTISVNHRLIDGVHVGRFYEALTARLAAL